MLFWILALLVAAFGIIIYKVRKSLLYWKDRGIAYKTPCTYIKDYVNLTLGKISAYDSIMEMYEEFPNERYNGLHQFNLPSVLIRDVELLKKILVKDFDHFVDHRHVDTNDEELFSKNLVQLRGQEWRDMRATLSPAFTASKMKAMFNLITECANNLTKYFLDKNEEEISLEMKELFTKYTNDVIATCAFGVQCDSLRDSKNDFFTMGTDATQIGFIRGIKFMFLITAPKLAKLLGITFFPKYIKTFFVGIISEAISYRTKHEIIRPDMIHLLMEARKGKLQHEEHEEQTETGFSVIEESNVGKQKTKNSKEITDFDIAAQAFIFFFAGFDTVSTMLSFMSYELALNPDIQEKLFQEITAVMATNNNKPNYESISNMKYLDMVVSETLRKWPPAPITDRGCVKDYLIKAEKAGEKDFLLKKGEMLGIPILAIQRDKQYFPDPDKFDPERFSDENKNNIIPFSYLPFGLGPRACIGNRFALLEIKILFTYLLSKFELTIIEKSVVPLKMAPGFQLTPKGGFWLGLKARKRFFN